MKFRVNISPPCATIIYLFLCCSCVNDLWPPWWWEKYGEFRDLCQMLAFHILSFLYLCRKNLFPHFEKISQHTPWLFSISLFYRVPIFLHIILSLSFLWIIISIYFTMLTAHILGRLSTAAIFHSAIMCAFLYFHAYLIRCGAKIISCVYATSHFQLTFIQNVTPNPKDFFCCVCWNS